MNVGDLNRSPRKEYLPTSLNNEEVGMSSEESDDS